MVSTDDVANPAGLSPLLQVGMEGFGLVPLEWLQTLPGSLADQMSNHGE
ncbi:MAG TPA: hypothetical protein VKR06_20955 [Ktedonosporobacter sp.]|nr:hypothetical protein [Ktedonosporobacter sp.]